LVNVGDLPSDNQTRHAGKSTLYDNLWLIDVDCPIKTPFASGFSSYVSLLEGIVLVAGLLVMVTP
jgi:hypothetical protein